MGCQHKEDDFMSVCCMYGIHLIGRAQCFAVNRLILVAAAWHAEQRSVQLLPVRYVVM
jgi:hypothetical protein